MSVKITTDGMLTRSFKLYINDNLVSETGRIKSFTLCKGRRTVPVTAVMEVFVDEFIVENPDVVVQFTIWRELVPALPVSILEHVCNKLKEELDKRG